MSNLVPFQFDTSTVRVITTDDDVILFVARDVATALGYADTINAVKLHCKKAKSLKDIGVAIHHPQQNQQLDLQTKVIPESDVYRLVMRSKLESAENFQDWLVEEVIPSIRKTGGYSLELPNFNNPVEAARAWANEAEQKQIAKAERDQALLQIEVQKQTLQHKDDLIRVSNEASIKAGEILIREFVKSQDLITLGEIQFFAWMRGQKIVFSDRNEPYQHYVKAGYFTYKPSEELHGGKFRYTMRVTPRGKVWLAAKYMAYLDAAGLAALDAEPQPRNGLVLLQGAQA